MKKKILFAYYSMIIGGSTTSLLSLINAIDRSKYDVYLILYRNNGELFNYIPENVTLLEPAASKKNLVNDIKKILLAIFKGYLFKGLSYQIKNKKNKFLLVDSFNNLNASIAMPYPFLCSIVTQIKTTFFPLFSIFFCRGTPSFKLKIGKL